MDVELLREKLGKCSAKSIEILDKAGLEDRDFTPDEIKKIDNLLAESDKLKKQIDRVSKVENLAGDLAEQALSFQGVGRKTQPTPIGRPNAYSGSQITVGNQREFSLGEMALAVQNQAVVARDGGSLNPKAQKILAAAPAEFSTEGTGADGGFAVPGDFKTEIMEKVSGEDSLLARCDQITTPSNRFHVPKDETTPWGSDGIQAYWEAEAGYLDPSKIALEGEDVKLNKLTALIPVSSELLEDAPALDSYLRRKVPIIFDWKVSDAIINGTGAGRPTGILNSGCVISIAKESGQAANTIQAENIINMTARLYGPCFKNAVWLANSDIRPQLSSLFIEGTSSSIPVFLPANALSAKPFETLNGRPIIFHQACQTLGDQGDIILADFSQYMAILKTGGIRDDVSIHLYFDYDLVAFRFIMRISGQPWWRTAITPPYATNTLSAFVTLDARA